MKNWNSFLLAVVAILTIMPVITIAESYVDAKPTPWFFAKVKLNPVSMPKGVLLDHERLTIINQSDVPLYVVRSANQPQEWIGVLPNNVMPISKVVSNSSYGYAYEKGEWYLQPLRRIGTQKIFGIDVFKALISHDRQSLRESSGHGRPQDILPPKAKNLIFSGYYGSQKIVFSGKLSYKVNENYGLRTTGDWFKFDQLTIENEGLPSGVEVKPLRRKQYGKYYNLHSAIFNSTDTPFYIVKLFEDPIEWLDYLPDDVLPMNKLISGKSYTPRDFQYRTQFWELKNHRALHLSPGYIHNPLSLYSPVIHVRGCRPEDVAIPPPQTFEIIMYYGKTRIPVSGQIVYEFNQSNSLKCDDNETDGTGHPWNSLNPERECSVELAGYGKRPSAHCYNYVYTNLRGPIMVVVPRDEVSDKLFAIGRGELSVGDWSKYCAFTAKCKTETNRQKHYMPQTGISMQQVKDYTQWLSKRTGKTYRIPNKAEWEYAARAVGKPAKKDWNCRLERDGKLIKGTDIVSVAMGKPNAWGLRNYIGNVQEWVTGKTGELLAVGGHYRIDIEDCNINFSVGHTGEADDITGFRVLRELQ